MPFQFYDGTICSAISIAVGHAKLKFDAIFTAIVKTIFKTTSCEAENEKAEGCG